MGRLAKIVLLLIVIVAGLYYFLGTPESEPYKLPTYITVEYPNTAIVNEPFRVYAKICYRIPEDVPETIARYIIQYGNETLLNEKKLVLYEGSTAKKTSYTNSTGIAVFYLSANTSSNYKVVFEGSRLLQKCESSVFTVQVSTGPSVSLMLSQNMLVLQAEDNASLTLTVQAIGDVYGEYSVSYSPQIAGVNIVFSPSTFILSNEQQINILIQTTMQTPAGTYNINVSVAGPYSSSVLLTLEIKAYVPPSVQLTADKYTAFVGEIVTLTAYVFNGKQPFYYMFYMNDTLEYSGSDNVYSLVRTSKQICIVYVKVVDKLNSETVSSSVKIQFVSEEDVTNFYVMVKSRLDLYPDGIITDDYDRTDLDSDGDVLAMYFGQTVPPAPEYVDINCDGYVNSKDGNILGAHIGMVVQASIYIDGSLVWTGKVDGLKMFVSKAFIGTHVVRVELITGEYSEESLNFVKPETVWSPTLFNPWKSTGSLSLFVLTGNVFIDVSRILSLIIVIVCIILLVYMVKKR